MQRALTVFLFILAIVGSASYGLYYLLKTPVTAENEAVIAVTKRDEAVTEKRIEVTLEEIKERGAITKEIADALEFTEKDAAVLYETYRVMQWDAYNEYLPSLFKEKYGLNEDEIKTLLTHSPIFLEFENDILSRVNATGTYVFYDDDSVAEVAEKLIVPVLLLPEVESYVHERIPVDSAEVLVAYIKDQNDLLPDLVPLPPQDLGIRYENGETLLVFSTVYYNKGDGDLELRADPSTIGVIGDFDRKVNQRIYQIDGTYRERPSGTFFWHVPHLHYHFADFVTYELTDENGTAIGNENEYLEKSTFCIRDVSKVDIGEGFVHSKAKYKICGRERQGITLGWGDAYFHTYPDQNIKITNLPSGTYRLTFNVNPEDRFEEITKENNIASALFEYEKNTGSVTVTETVPVDLPAFEHIHIEQQL